MRDRRIPRDAILPYNVSSFRYFIFLIFSLIFKYSFLYFSQLRLDCFRFLFILNVLGTCMKVGTIRRS